MHWERLHKAKRLWTSVNPEIDADTYNKDASADDFKHNLKTRR
jgi:hypothetical protein